MLPVQVGAWPLAEAPRCPVCISEGQEPSLLHVEQRVIGAECAGSSGEPTNQRRPWLLSPGDGCGGPDSSGRPDHACFPAGCLGRPCEAMFPVREGGRPARPRAQTRTIVRRSPKVPSSDLRRTTRGVCCPRELLLSPSVANPTLLRAYRTPVFPRHIGPIITFSM